MIFGKISDLRTICCSGSVIRFIGRADKETSPVRLAVKAAAQLLHP